MKIDFIKTLIAIAISALLAYLCYFISNFDNVRVLLTITTGVVFAITLVFTLGVTLNGDSRKAIMVKTTSGVFFTGFLALNLCFAFFNFNKPIFVIVNGILLLLYTLVANVIWKAKTK